MVEMKVGTMVARSVDWKAELWAALKVARMAVLMAGY
jgi:hypothetical protein